MLFYHADGTTDYANYPYKTKDKPQIFRYLKGAPAKKNFSFQINFAKNQTFLHSKNRLVEKTTNLIGWPNIGYILVVLTNILVN